MSTEPIIKEIRQNWMIIMFIVTLIISWATMNARLAQAENKIDQLEALTIQINQMQTDIAVIKANVEFIKTQI